MRPGRLRHHATSFLDEQQRGLPRNRARRGQRCDLAQAVTRGDAYVFQAVAFAPHLVRRPADGHDARLDDVGAVQLLDRALEAKLADRHLQHLFGALEDAAGGCVPVIEVLTHAQPLDSLSRKEQRDGSGEIYAHPNLLREGEQARLPGREALSAYLWGPRAKRGRP